MHNLSKGEAMKKWLEANPGKTERDWLIEERCASDEQRQMLKEVFANCGEEYIPIPVRIYLSDEGVSALVRHNYHKKYPEIFGITHEDDEWQLELEDRFGNFDHPTMTDLEFDFSLFGKYYFDLNDNKWSIDGQDTPSNQWKKCLIDKLSNLTDIDKTDADNIASLIILDNSKLMRETPLYRFGSPEFKEAFDYEVSRRKYIKENGFDKTPKPQTRQPYFRNVAYNQPSDPHILTVREFLEKATGPNMCKGGRLIIAIFNDKENALWFPDEAVCSLSDNTVYSGYYEESPVIIPGPIELDKVPEFQNYSFNPSMAVLSLSWWNVPTESLDEPLEAHTKRNGIRSVMDVVPLECSGKAYIALVVK